MTWLTATEALQVLGVRPQTLYANVSRKKIRAKPDPKDIRRSLYHEVDVRKWARQHGGRRKATVVAAGAIEWGDPVLSSAVSTVADGRLYYRGKEAVGLSEAETLEGVAGLLWGADAVDFDLAWRQWAESEARTRTPRARNQLPSSTPLQRAFLSLGRRAGTDVSSYGRALPVLQAEAAGVLVALAAAILGRGGTAVLQAGAADGANPQQLRGRGGRPAPKRRTLVGAGTALRQGASAEPRGEVRHDGDLPRCGDALHERIAVALGCPPAADVLRRALVLIADHELNASTFATRVTVSTGAPLSAGVLSGLATLSGPLHGRASLGVLELLASVERLGADKAVRDWLSQGRPIAGFGHPLYPAGDPRGAALLQHLTLPRVYTELSAVVEDLIGERPNIDFALATLTKVHGLPPDAPLILFALGRCAGWLAHALEQVTTGHPIRPRARYVGPPVS